METLHEMIDRRFETGDTRLMYGITVPLLIGVVAISLLLAVDAWWLLVPTLLCVIVLAVTVAIGVTKMLDESD
jgi:putative effector of murein hydrolase LrgA (UPF0299 family)